MNETQETWRRLLQLDEPWRVLRFQHDEAGKRFDIWIGQEEPRTWFRFGRRGAARPVDHFSWRHVNFGRWRVHLYVEAPVGASLAECPWAGEQDLPFSRELSRQVFGLLKANVSLQNICDLLDLPVAELWRFRYAMDSGRWAASEVVADQIQVAEEADADIPGHDDPVWEALVDGSLQIDIRVLGLKLLLTRLRSQLDMITDKEIRGLKLQEFQRYFAKNKQMLTHELDQLRGEQHARA